MPLPLLLLLPALCLLLRSLLLAPSRWWWWSRRLCREVLLLLLLLLCSSCREPSRDLRCDGSLDMWASNFLLLSSPMVSRVGRRRRKKESVCWKERKKRTRNSFPTHRRSTFTLPTLLDENLQPCSFIFHICQEETRKAAKRQASECVVCCVFVCLCVCVCVAFILLSASSSLLSSPSLPSFFLLLLPFSPLAFTKVSTASVLALLG